VNGQIVQSALRELQSFLRSPRFWGTFAAVVLIFWITGPFGTADSLAAAPRFGFWLVIHAATWACALVFVVMADLLLEGFVGNRFARMMAGAVLAAPVIGLVTETLRAATFGNAITPAGYAAAVGVGLTLSVLFCVLTWLSMSPAEQKRPLPETAAASPAQAPLLRRLAPANRGVLLHLCVQDHYVEIVTARGRELVLMRFSDALGELGGTPGLRVHRSHWVADAAVETFARDDGRLAVTLKSGNRIPVSRPYAAAARARWG
jgi:DNA-binding LytR/AlgR family response regulator